MRTWRDYIKDTKIKDPAAAKDIEEMEMLAAIITAIISKREELGYTQRELAVVCDLPQSSIARIESCVVVPKLDTLIKIMIPLGLSLSVISA